MADKTSGEQNQQRYGFPLVSVEAPLPTDRTGWKDAFQNLVSSFESVRALADSSETDPVPEYPILCFLVWARRCSQLVKLYEIELRMEAVLTAAFRPDGIVIPEEPCKRLAKYGEGNVAFLEALLARHIPEVKLTGLRRYSDEWFRFQAKRAASIVGKLSPEVMFSDWSELEGLLWAAKHEIAEAGFLADTASGLQDATYVTAKELAVIVGQKIGHEAILKALRGCPSKEGKQGLLSFRYFEALQFLRPWCSDHPRIRFREVVWPDFVPSEKKLKKP